jgi:fructose-1,6-bisphosphatase I
VALRYKQQMAASAVTHDFNLDPVTLMRFILEEEAVDGHDLSLILQSIAIITKVISSAIQKSGIKGLEGLQGNVNVQGEDQQKLDVLSNTAMVNILKSSKAVGLMISEEDEQPIVGNPLGEFGIAFDPLDGSSNIECNVAVGTIFAIYKSESGPIKLEDMLKPGRNLVAAGYVLYSSSTIMVLARQCDTGVQVFTLDPTLGEYIMTRRNWTLPEKPKTIYSINCGNSELWDDATKAFVNWAVTLPSPYSLRYIGSMVADVHRTLLYGGIFLYPADKKSKNGKLRLLYECNPMSFLLVKAGGAAHTGHTAVLDVVPTSIHQRCPVILGCKRDVDKFVSFCSL